MWRDSVAAVAPSSRALCSLTLLAALSASASAQAQTQTPAAQLPSGARVVEAQRHIVAAMTAFRAHDYSTAIHEFELSYRAAPDADVWYNLARARELSNDYEGAVGDYQRYLRDKVDPPDRADVERTIRSLQSLMEHQAAASRRQAEGAQVRFELARRDARLFLDGQELPAGEAGVARRIATGDHAVRVTAPGAQEWDARVRVRTGEVATVFAAPAPATRYETRPAGHVTSIVLACLGAASLGTAGYFAIRAAGQDCAACDAQVTQSNRSDIFLGVGAGLAVGAAVAFFVERASGGTVRVASP